MGGKKKNRALLVRNRRPSPFGMPMLARVARVPPGSSLSATSRVACRWDVWPGRGLVEVESETRSRVKDPRSCAFSFTLSWPDRALPDLGHSPRLRGLLPGGRAFLLGGLLPLGVGQFSSEAARRAPFRRPGVPLRRRRTHVRRPLPLGVAFGGGCSSLASSCSEAARRAPSQRRSVPRRRRAPV